MHVLVLHRPGSPPERRPLAGTLRAGGSQDDDLHLPGAPPAALRLSACPAGAVLEADAPGVRAGDRAVPAGDRRLLRPGERAELHGVDIALEREAPPPGSTRAAAAALLRDAAAGVARLARVHLVVLTGPEAGACHPIGDVETLGRGRRATLRIADPHASRLHASLRRAPGGVVVEDLSSKNGTRVNGARVRRSLVLRPGDELAIGRTALALEDAERAAEVAPGPAPLRGRARRLPAPALAFALLALAAALALAAR